MKHSNKIIASSLVAGTLVMHSTLADGQTSTSVNLSQDETIKRFEVHVPKEKVQDLKRRLIATRWPDKETVSDKSQGVQLDKLQELVHYWSTDYDWRKAEAKLNALPQFLTNIDGVDIHFIHVRSKEPNALPVIIIHGWPGSIFELLKIVGPLTDPTSYGGKAEDAFDVVIPSLPGYGFSGKPGTTGWDPEHIAQACTELMKRLGYTRFVAQGGDWGAVIAEAMGRQTPSGLRGIHINLPATVPPEIDKALNDGGPAPAGISTEERAVFDALSTYRKTGSAGKRHRVSLRHLPAGPAGNGVLRHLNRHLRHGRRLRIAARPRDVAGAPQALSFKTLMNPVTRNVARGGVLVLQGRSRIAP